MILKSPTVVTIQEPIEPTRTFTLGCDFNAGLCLKELHGMAVSELVLWWLRVGLSDVKIRSQPWQ